MLTKVSILPQPDSDIRRSDDWGKMQVQNRFIISPSFIARSVPQLAGLPFDGAVINDPEQVGETEQARAVCVHRPLADLVAKAARDGRRPVSIAGDCCTTIAVLAGLQRAGLAPLVIWLDAHGDFNTWETSPSGFLGGMPLAMITGRGDMTMADAVGLEAIADEDVILADGRDLDPLEAEAVAASGTRHVADYADLLDLVLPDRPLYVHFDSDVIDSREAPGHNYPVPGGPGAALVIDVMQRLAASGQVVATSMSCWNPDLDVDGRTQKVCMAAFWQLIDAS